MLIKKNELARINLAGSTKLLKDTNFSIQHIYSAISLSESSTNFHLFGTIFAHLQYIICLMKKYTLIPIAAIVLSIFSGCATLDDLDSRCNLTGSKKIAPFHSNLSLTADDQQITGEIKERPFSYHLDFTMGHKNLSGDISFVPFRHRINADFDGMSIEGVWKHCILKDSVHIIVGNKEFSGVIKHGVLKKTYDLQYDNEYVYGTLEEEIGREVYDLTVGDQVIFGEVLEGIWKEIYNLNFTELSEEHTVLFLLIDIFRHIENEIEKRQRSQV